MAGNARTRSGREAVLTPLYRKELFTDMDIAESEILSVSTEDEAATR